MFQKVDCVRLRVEKLDQALEFYRDALGHELLWRRGDTEAGLRLTQSDTELVLFVGETLLPPGVPEVDLLVESVDDAIPRLQSVGARLVEGPFSIPVGRCAIIDDPFGNRIVVLDLSKGAVESGTDLASSS